MARIIDLKTFTDVRGNLTVIEKVIPFEIKRVFYIYGVLNETRGMHRHLKTRQAAIAIKGSCEIWNQTFGESENKLFSLNNPSKCLIIDPEDFHWMNNFSDDCILMVFASEYFDPADYIYEPYFKI